MNRNVIGPGSKAIFIFQNNTGSGAALYSPGTAEYPGQSSTIFLEQQISVVIPEHSQARVTEKQSTGPAEITGQKGPAVLSAPEQVR